MKIKNPITDPKMFTSAQRYYADAQTLHSAGVEEFGGLWFGANENLVGIARSWGIDPSDPALRQFFALIALRVLRAGSPAGKRSRLVNTNGSSR
jgi:hypothetical protein